jgi:hypothetical protein
MAEVVSLNEARAVAAGDCRLWTVVDALRSALADVESGKLDAQMVFVAFRTNPNESGLVDYKFVAAGGNNIELSGLLAQHLHRLCR